MDLGSTNPTNSAAINDMVQTQTGQNSQDIGRGYAQAGAEAGRGLLTRDDSAFNKGLAYGDSATSDAIKSRYLKDFAQDEKKLTHDSMMKAGQDRLKTLQVTADLAGQEVEMNRQKELLKWKMKQAKKQARAQMIGSVLGIAGAAGGAAGGPGGAMVGMSAGQAAGNMVGGS